MENPVTSNETAARGRSGEARTIIRRIVASYDDLVTRLYSTVRFTILRQPFLEEIGQYLPARGRVLDLGCGFGLFSLYYAARAGGRRITGIDLNAARIERARESAGKLGLSNVEYVVADVLEWRPAEPFNAIYLLDVVHHLPAAEVPEFLERLRSYLTPGGVLVLKDVADRPRLKMLFTLLLDRLMVGFEPIRYWPPEELIALLARLGFRVYRHRMTDFLPYPHILYVARLDPAEAA
ncbi:MAG: class I SAM-dependent methyltransferase [bacterium]|nr:class I SAM-dependent methyltransferase [bacterium]